MPQEPDDREYTPDESRLKTSFRECIPLFIALGVQYPPSHHPAAL